MWDGSYKDEGWIFYFMGYTLYDFPFRELDLITGTLQMLESEAPGRKVLEGFLASYSKKAPS